MKEKSQLDDQFNLPRIVKKKYSPLRKAGNSFAKKKGHMVISKRFK